LETEICTPANVDDLTWIKLAETHTKEPAAYSKRQGFEKPARNFGVPEQPSGRRRQVVSCVRTDGRGHPSGHADCRACPGEKVA
jgi:hypothetical protein